MKTFDYFTKAVEKELHLYRGWCIHTFAILQGDTLVEDDYGLKIENGKVSVKFDNEWEILEDYVPNNPIFPIDTVVTLPTGYLDFVETEVKTTYGCLMMNVMLVRQPYGGKVKYINGHLVPRIINGMAEKMLARPSGSPAEKRMITQEHLVFEEMCSFITLFSRYINVCATPKMLRNPVKTLALRDKLLAENKDKLTDPLVAAEIHKQLAKSLKEEFKDDEGMVYMYYDKIFNIALMRTKVMYGAEPDFVDPSHINFIPRSLQDGWNVEDIPVLTNSARGASADRGKNTALGGAAVKDVTRITQNYTIDIEDCNSKVGLAITVNPDNYKRYEGRFVVGKVEPLTLADLESLISKTILIRSPGTCKAKPPSYCRVCFGSKVTGTRDAIKGQAVTFYNKYMLAYMKNMHATDIKVEKFKFTDRIT